MNMKIVTLLSIVIALSFCTFAETIIVDAVDTGWYDERGYHYYTNSNILGVNNAHQYSSYLIFSIPEFEGTVSEVTLSLELIMYASYDEFENVRVSAVSTSIDQLISFNSNVPEIYEDLRDGPELGVMQVELKEPLFPFIWLSNFQGQGPVFSCVLNEKAVQLIQDNQGGQFALGLSLMDLSGNEKEYVSFNSSDIPVDYTIQQLQITTIPEPATILLTVAGGVIVSMKRRRTNRN